MSDDLPCGRPLYDALPGMDNRPVCLMHSRDPNKHPGEFQDGIHAILNSFSPHNRSPELFDFTRFVFPTTDFTGSKLKKEVSFRLATFTQDANFSGATFTENANFSLATFSQNAYFGRATFSQNADFLGARFTTFVDFSLARFTHNAFFGGALFNQYANFGGAVVTQDAYFSSAMFCQNAYFYSTTFTRNAYFFAATFSQDANFRRATFGQNSTFHRTKFHGFADFSSTWFERPSGILFHRTNQDIKGLRIRFGSALLEGVRFEDVNWHIPDDRLILQDELDLGDPKPETTHEVVADAYRRLVNNFQEARQYELAEKAFISEMEMRRLNPRNFFFNSRGKHDKFYEDRKWAHWIGRNISALQVYRLFSVYGSSYARALGVLGLFLLAFAIGFPAFGVRVADAPAPPAESNVAANGCANLGQTISWRCALSPEPPHGRAREFWQTLKSGLLATFQTATLHRKPHLEPISGGGRALAIGVVIAIPGQLTLLFLALRRRFKR